MLFDPDGPLLAREEQLHRVMAAEGAVPATWRNWTVPPGEPRCPCCRWTLIWAPYTRWEEYRRGSDRRSGLRLVRRLRRGGFSARLIPSSAVAATVGQPSSWYAELERDLQEFESKEPF